VHQDGVLPLGFDSVGEGAAEVAGASGHGDDSGHDVELVQNPRIRYDVAPKSSPMVK